MEEKIECPKCRKMNDVHKFCVYCGGRLPVSDAEIRLKTEKSGPYCLNCGRPVKKGQVKCECGYEIADIHCPDCNAENPYTNTFCTACGNKLWNSNVWNITSDNFRTSIPELRYTSLYRRSKNKIITHSREIYCLDIHNYEEIDKFLTEIGSRWKIVSPNYCINCLNIIKPNELTCEKCNFQMLGDEKRVESLKTSKYVKPEFQYRELKWTSREIFPYYMDSLAPAIGESQFEYRERLKWEFTDSITCRHILKNKIEHKKEIEEHLKEIREYYKDMPRVNDGPLVVPDFSWQYDEFSDEVIRICKAGGGDTKYLREGLVSCPMCSGYFHYLSERFVETRRCPYCGSPFNISAKIYETEWDYYGLSYEEYMEEFMGKKRK